MSALHVLTADVTAAVVICPIAAITLPTKRRAAAFMLASVATWLFVSAGLLAATAMELQSVLVSHLVIATVAAAAASIGRTARAVCIDPLDGVAIAVTTCAALSFGVFAMGRFAGELSPAALNAVLAANPFVATASAAKIDIFHTPLLYRASPLAHQLYEYPAWQLSAGVFAVIGVTCGMIPSLFTRLTLSRGAQ